MQEYNFLIRAALENGLAPRAKVRPNAPFMETTQNLKGDAAGGCVSPEPMVYPVTGADVSWPFPQIFRGEKTTVLLGSTVGYGIDESTWAKTAFAANPFTAGLSWQFASFQETWFATNGTTLLYATAKEDHVPAKYTAMAFRALAAHQDRLFVAGLSGAYLSNAAFTALFAAWRATRPDAQVVHEDMAVSGNWVLWCQRGGGDTDWPFRPFLTMLGFDTGLAYNAAGDLTGYFRDCIERGEIGMTPCRWPGNILHMKPLGEYGLVLYGENGISHLSSERDGAGYEETKLADFGVLSRNSVGGTDRTHVFVDAKRQLWRWQLGEGMRLLDYGHLLAASAGTPEVLVSWDERRRECWISDGTWSYLLTDKGLFGPMSWKPTSLLNAADGKLVAPVSGLAASYTCILRTCPIDMNERGLKHVSQVSASMRGLTDTKCWVEYVHSNRDSYKSGRVVPMNYNGVGFPHTSFSDGKIVVQCTGTGSAEVHYIDMRWQPEDARFRRGTQAAPEVG